MSVNGSLGVLIVMAPGATAEHVSAAVQLSAAEFEGLAAELEALRAVTAPLPAAADGSRPS